MLCFCLVFKSKTRVRIFKTLLSVLQILFWGEEGSGVYHFHWRKPRGFQSPARAPLWRLGGTKHLLSRYRLTDSKFVCQLVWLATSLTYIITCLQVMLVLFATKGSELVAYLAFSNHVTTGRVFVFVCLAFQIVESPLLCIIFTWNVFTLRPPWIPSI